MEQRTVCPGDVLHADRLAALVLRDLGIERFDDPRSAPVVLLDMATKPGAPAELATACVNAAEGIPGIMAFIDRHGI